MDHCKKSPYLFPLLNQRVTLIVLLSTSLLLIGLSACQSAEKPPLPPAAIAATPYPTFAPSFEGDTLAERLTLREQIQPQPGAIASSRVEALIQIHGFAEAYITALDNHTVSLDELTSLIQLAANARASLYNTGQLDMIELANTAGWLIDLVIYGDWELAESSIWNFQRSLPRKPSLE